MIVCCTVFFNLPSDLHSFRLCFALTYVKVKKCLLYSCSMLPLAEADNMFYHTHIHTVGFS